MVEDDDNKGFYSKASLMISMIAILISVVSVGYTIYINEQSKKEELILVILICFFFCYILRYGFEFVR